MKIIATVPQWLLLLMFTVPFMTETICSSAMPAYSAVTLAPSIIVQKASGFYFLGFAIGILSLGRISDIVGRRPVMLFGMLLYSISSLLCSLISNIYIVLFLRFIQAFGASVTSVVTHAMTRESYKDQELAYIYINAGFCFAVSPSIGSFLGGFLAEYLGYEYNFIFLCIFGACIFITCYLLLEETNPYLGETLQTSYLSVLKVILRDRVVLLYAVIVGSHMGIMFSFFMKGPFIFKKIIPISTLIYGLMMFAVTIFNIIGNVLNRHLIKNYVPSNKIFLLGLSTSFIGIMLFMINSSNINIGVSYKYLPLLVFFIPLILHMMSYNMVTSHILRFALEDYGKVSGTAGAIFGSTYYIFAAFISYIVSRLTPDDINAFSLMIFCFSALSLFSAFLIFLMERDKYSVEN